MFSRLLAPTKSNLQELNLRTLPVFTDSRLHVAVLGSAKPCEGDMFNVLRFHQDTCTVGVQGNLLPVSCVSWLYYCMLCKYLKFFLAGLVDRKVY